MSARTLIVDSGGTTRQTKRWALVDSGGTTRLAKRVFLVDSGGTPRLIFSGADNLSMLVGTAANDNGYVNGAFGVLTPNTLGDGSIVQELAVATHLAPTPFQLVFTISNYPGTITQAYLTSLTINASLVAPGDPNYTGFTGGTPGGTAQWIWQNQGVPIVGNTIPIVVTRT
jgi:hypothetical protein